MEFAIILAILAGVIYFVHWKAAELRAANPINAQFFSYINCILVAVWVLLLVLRLD